MAPPTFVCSAPSGARASQDFGKEGGKLGIDEFLRVKSVGIA